MHFMFSSPYFLLLLFLLPCFFWCKPYAKLYYFSKLSWLSPQSQLLSWEAWLKVLIFTLLVFALSKPFVYDAKKTMHKKGRDLILVLDTSGSMGERGFDKDNRILNKFDINIALAQDFIKQRYDDNMGIVLFGTFAYTASPLTYDLSSLSYLLGLSTLGIAGESTAIGDAISQAVDTLSYGEASSKAIVLLTDGYHNAGRNSPKKAVQKAKEQGIKVYTIGIGKKSNYDAFLLETIAKETFAQSYAASSAKALRDIYQEINTLEPSPIRSENYLNQKILMFIPLSLAWILLLLWIVLSRKGLL